MRDGNLKLYAISSNWQLRGSKKGNMELFSLAAGFARLAARGLPPVTRGAVVVVEAHSKSPTPSPPLVAAAVARGGDGSGDQQPCSNQQRHQTRQVAAADKELGRSASAVQRESEVKSALLQVGCPCAPFLCAHLYPETETSCYIRFR